MIKPTTYVLLIIISLTLFLPVSDGASPFPVRARHGMVVSAHQLASEIGVSVLRQGGNAVDAAVAVGFALAVVFPEAGNIGGGGFMLIRKSDGSFTSIDFREKAPKAASRAMYLDSLGNITNKSVDGHLSAGVPGTVAGFVKALEDFGTMKLHDVIQPSVDLAEKGFIVDRNLAFNLNDYDEFLKIYPATVTAFYRNGSPLLEGDTLRQPDLAATLRRIQEDGNDGFYNGETARLIVEEMNRGGGLISFGDLEEYEAVTRNPLRFTYRGYEIVSMSPPSSGGICLAELLNIVEGYDLASMGYNSSRTIHILTEAMKRVYADRAEFMGDPDFYDVPVGKLISKEYATKRRAGIDTVQAIPANMIRHGEFSFREGENTTHFVVADAQGNVVSTTYTLNDLFGSKVVVGGAGFFLNDEMDDFSAKPGVPNIYGLVGGEANAIEPEKRPLSSMAPTIVLKDGKPFMALGARGGSKIITSIFQTIVNVIDFNMNIQQAVDAPRFHHQWLPDTIRYEKFGLAADVIENLQKRGHIVNSTSATLGELEAMFFDQKNGWIYGAPDPREGGVAIGY